MIDMNAIRQRWEAVGSTLDERGRRLFAAVEALTAGCGGLALRDFTHLENLSIYNDLGEWLLETIVVIKP